MSYDISEKIIELSQSIEEAPTHPPPLTDSNKQVVNEEEMHFKELNSSADASANTSTDDSASVNTSLFSV